MKERREKRLNEMKNGITAPKEIRKRNWLNEMKDGKLCLSL